MNIAERRYSPDSNEYLAIRLYNEMNVLAENNHNGRYDKAILDKKRKLNSVLSKISKNQRISAVAGI